MLLDIPLTRPGERTRCGNLRGASDALAIAEMAAARRPLLVLTAGATDAQRLLAEIGYFAPALRACQLPDWETLPYDGFSPHQDLVSERLATLYRIAHQDFDVALAPVTTALYRMAPAEYLAGYSFFLKQGEVLDLDALRAQLAFAGYSHVTQVVAPGEFSVRGGLIDLFPMGSSLPFRIDLLDREIETIRTFDVDTQRSIYPVKEIRLLPAREFPLDDGGRARFRANFRERFEGDPSRCQLYREIGQGGVPAGIEYYLPLFFEKTATLFDYLAPGTLLVTHRDAEGAIRGFWQDTRSRYQLLRGDKDRPLLPPGDLFLAEDEFFGALKGFARVEIEGSGVADQGPGVGGRSSAVEASAIRDPQSEIRDPNPSPLAAHGSPLTSPLPPLAVDRKSEKPLGRFAGFLEAFPGRVLVAAEGLGRREIMADYFREQGLQPALVETWSDFLSGDTPLALGVAPLSSGFMLPGRRLAVVTEAELYATQVRARSAREGARKLTAEGVLKDLTEVKPGDPVVHESHGIGRYQGLVSLDLGEGATEFLLLEYAEGDKLYVPVAQLHLISRYSGAQPEEAPLHKLGSGQWDKARRKAMEQVRDTAAELLNLYARRAARKGHAFTFRPHDYAVFADSFQFEETPDQLAAISAVLEDLTIGRPMDRLVCGDVGFGKTEVALRAAFVAVADGRQVAVLVPTTLLAEQHFNNFSDRFAEWPVKIAELSRFRSAREQEQALEGLAQGKIDIVIGTHKLLQKGVKFKDLGLVIIDEEHRFGVRQKEALKRLRAEVDVLTLTATPIPRTLAMSLEGLRDFSVIATAPQRRLAIKTFVSRHSEGIVREAVLRELKRGGQVYFLHNEVETIQSMRARLEALLPEARIQVAHGQMRERELEHVMRDFYQNRSSVLLCTTIIETGIDVPNANTIIIHRADKFGLAQLHQLRGRVGRSHHQAYAYLLTPEENGITAQARKRLEAIQLMEQLGSGFYLAMHDLEIRGAGEVLGESQSGEMQEVGFSLYTRMLDAAVKSLKAGREPDMQQPLGVTTEINLHLPALLPESYVSDVHERLVLYKRLANCETPEDLEDMQQELVDRFGLLPEPARALVECHRLRILAKPLGVARIDAGADALLLQFVPNPPVDPGKIIALVQSRRDMRFSGQDRLRLERGFPTLAERSAGIRDILKALV
ncbi:MAG TPA: transcription-repair coupling factor [Burkholderiales bacterium]|nr:transcription-repair coupling factor [Burkholderiales bacterium]